MTVYNRLASPGIALPEVNPRVAAFEPWVRSGSQIWLPDDVAREDGKPWVGKLGDSLGMEDGVAAAKFVAIDLLGTLNAAVGDLRQERRILKIMVLVNSENNFTQQHLVANGAAELLVQEFAEIGHHARSAFGVGQIPLGSCVEIELDAEVE